MSFGLWQRWDVFESWIFKALEWLNRSPKIPEHSTRDGTSRCLEKALGGVLMNWPDLEATIGRVDQPSTEAYMDKKSHLFGIMDMYIFLGLTPPAGCAVWAQIWEREDLIAFASSYHDSMLGLC